MVWWPTAQITLNSMACLWGCGFYFLLLASLPGQSINFTIPVAFPKSFLCQVMTLCWSPSDCPLQPECLSHPQIDSRWVWNPACYTCPILIVAVSNRWKPWGVASIRWLWMQICKLVLSLFNKTSVCVNKSLEISKKNSEDQLRHGISMRSKSECCAWHFLTKNQSTISQRKIGSYVSWKVQTSNLIMTKTENLIQHHLPLQSD
jgi:hypothetical protein